MDSRTSSTEGLEPLAEVVFNSGKWRVGKVAVSGTMKAKAGHLELYLDSGRGLVIVRARQQTQGSEETAETWAQRYFPVSAGGVASMEPAEGLEKLEALTRAGWGEARAAGTGLEEVRAMHRESGPSSSATLLEGPLQGFGFRPADVRPPPEYVLITPDPLHGHGFKVEGIRFDELAPEARALVRRGIDGHLWLPYRGDNGRGPIRYHVQLLEGVDSLAHPGRTVIRATRPALEPRAFSGAELESLAGEAFNTYGDTPGPAGAWNTYDGKPMPRLVDLRQTDAGKLTLHRWAAGVGRVLEVVGVKLPDQPLTQPSGLDEQEEAMREELEQESVAEERAELEEPRGGQHRAPRPTEVDGMAQDAAQPTSARERARAGQTRAPANPEPDELVTVLEVPAVNGALGVPEHNSRVADLSNDQRARLERRPDGRLVVPSPAAQPTAPAESEKAPRVKPRK